MSKPRPSFYALCTELPRSRKTVEKLSGTRVLTSFGPTVTISGAPEPDSSPSLDLQPTFGTPGVLPGTETHRAFHPDSRSGGSGR